MMEIALVITIIICITFYEVKLIGERSIRRAELKDICARIDKLEENIDEIKDIISPNDKSDEDKIIVIERNRENPPYFDPSKMVCVYGCPITTFDDTIGDMMTTLLDNSNKKE